MVGLHQNTNKTHIESECSIYYRETNKLSNWDRTRLNAEEHSKDSIRFLGLKNLSIPSITKFVKLPSPHALTPSYKKSALCLGQEQRLGRSLTFSLLFAVVHFEWVSVTLTIVFTFTLSLAPSLSLSIPLSPSTCRFHTALQLDSECESSFPGDCFRRQSTGTCRFPFWLMLQPPLQMHSPLCHHCPTSTGTVD